MSMEVKGSLVLQLYEWYKDPPSFFKALYNENPYPYQAMFLKDLPTIRRAMVLAAGGLGKTKVLSCAGLWLAVVYSFIKKKPYNVIILSGSLDQSRKLYEYSATVLQEHPILSKFVSGEVMKQMTNFTTGSYIKALPLSLKSIQGQHAPAVLVDEAALVDDFTIMDTYRIIGGEQAYPDNKLILSGTPTNYSSMFVEMWEDEKKYPDYEMTKDPLDWKRYSWSAFDCPRFSSREIEEMKNRLTDEQFTIFWLGKPYPVTNTVVPVHLIRKQSIGYEKFPYTPDKKTGTVVFGIDYGMTDYSVIVVVEKVETGTGIGYEYRVIDCIEWKGQQYDNVHDWILHYAKLYRPDYIFVDLNPKGESERTVNKLSPMGYYVQPINLGTERGSLQIRMKYLFEHDGIKIPQDFQPLLNNIKNYRWDTSKGDDYVTALMLAIREYNTTSDTSEFGIVKRSMKRILV